MKRPTWIPVVTALIVNKGKVLLGQRPETGSLAGQWEFPGGKIEIGESPEQALKRELQEELGIEAKIGELQMATSHAYGDKAVLLLFFDVSFWNGEPKSIHHLDLKWVEPNELSDLSIPDANKKHLSEIQKVLKSLF